MSKSLADLKRESLLAFAAAILVPLLPELKTKNDIERTLREAGVNPGPEVI